MTSDDHQPDPRQVRLALLEGMVLSASGWRAVFGGEDSSLSPSISSGYRDIMMCAAAVYAEAVISQRKNPTIVVGTDTRPTGPAIADTAIRTFLACGVSVRWLGVSAAPEIMSYTKLENKCDGFFYISASHNPPGHNGLKLGFGDGAVMPATRATVLIDAFRQRVDDDGAVSDLSEKIAAIPAARMEKIFADREALKSQARDTYRRFTLRVGAGDEADIETFVARIQRSLTDRPLGIVAELNGSARATSIDHSFFPELGIKLAVHNDIPGTFAHQILPEGAGLDEACRLLERYNRIDPAFQIAYVPDNDGDRGNLVFIDPDSGKAIPLDAQTVFALVVMVELAWTQKRGKNGDRVTVVANGPTSLRIERVCAHFGALAQRVEVGEANAVNRGLELQREGWTVPILGEGSNGGNITPPGTVRDPLSTLLGMIKLRAFDLAALWNTLIAPDASFIDIARTLPAFQTLQTDDPRAKMHVGSVSQVDLKRAYEAVLPDRIAPVIERLESHYGTSFDYRIINYEQTESREGAGNRTGKHTGGLRVVFRDSDGVDRAAVWMRGSGTEPLFRILADCEGESTDLLDTLVQWQRQTVDAAIARGES